MPTDRIIRWAAPSLAPTLADLGGLCEDYTRGIAPPPYWAGGRWNVTLPGEIRSALHNLDARRAGLYEPGRARCIEVWRSNDGESVYVITRSADEVTSAVADGLAALVARHWGGEREC